MATTNHTPTIELSQYASTDKTSYLVNYNDDMLKIDTAIAADRDNINTAQNTANTAEGKADTNKLSIDAINEELNNETSGLAPRVAANSNAINTINSLIGNGEPTTADKTLIGAINELAENLDNSQRDIIFISASYGSTPSAELNCLTILSTMLEGIYRNIYTSTHGGDSFHDGTYLTQLQAVEVADADSVKDIVIVGIGNDINAQFADVRSAMVAFYNYAHATYPNAKISIAPVSTRTNPTDAQALYSLYVQMVASMTATKISVFTQIFHVLAYYYSEISDDGIHPTAIGANSIARAIFNVLCGGGYEYSHYVELNNVSDHEVADANLTATMIFYFLQYSGKGIKVRYGINFTPTADETMGVNWTTGVALTKDTHLKGIADINGNEISVSLVDMTAGTFIPAAVTLNYNSTNGYYWELNPRTGKSETLLAGHNYYLRANGYLSFDTV